VALRLVYLMFLPLMQWAVLAGAEEVESAACAGQ
jgi:hypothetical protein